MRPYSGRKWMSRRSGGRPPINARQRSASRPSAERTSKGIAGIRKEAAARRPPLGDQVRAEPQAFQYVERAFGRMAVAVGRYACGDLSPKLWIVHRLADRLRDGVAVERHIDDVAGAHPVELARADVDGCNFERRRLQNAAAGVADHR